MNNIMVLVPKNNEYGTMRRAWAVIRNHLTTDGVNSLCGRGKPENFRAEERPNNNKNICVHCLIAEDRLKSPKLDEDSLPDELVYGYDLVFYLGRGKKPSHYTRHILDKNGNHICGHYLVKNLFSSPMPDIFIQECQFCRRCMKSHENK